jgi:DNA-binding transcriptional regulator YiaG
LIWKKKPKICYELLGERIDNKPQYSSIGNKKLSGINSFTGVAVRNARKKLKLSYVAFAKKLGVSATTVSRWENKGREKLELKPSNVKALSKLLLSK